MIPVLAKFTDALDRTTAAAIARLAGLESDITRAIADARADAAVQIEGRLQLLEGRTARDLHDFEEHVYALADDAIAHALAGLEERIRLMAGQGEQAEGEPTPDAPADEPTPTPTTPVDVSRPQAEEPDPTAPNLAAPAPLAGQVPLEPTETSTVVGGGAGGRVYAPVAARSLERDEPGVILDDSNPADGDRPEDLAGQVPGVVAGQVADQAHGLHERRGRGRSARYVPVELPVPGTTYYRKDGGRWVALEYAA